MKLWWASAVETWKVSRFGVGRVPGDGVRAAVASRHGLHRGGGRVHGGYEDSLAVVGECLAEHLREIGEGLVGLWFRVVLFFGGVRRPAGRGAPCS